MPKPKDGDNPKWMQDFAKAMLPIMSNFNQMTEPVRHAMDSTVRGVQNMPLLPPGIANRTSSRSSDVYAPVRSALQGMRPAQQAAQRSGAPQGVSSIVEVLRRMFLQK